MERKNIWENFDKIVSLKGANLKEIAQNANLNYDTIRSWRSRNRLPDINEGMSLAKAIGVSVEQLFFGEEPSPTVVNEGYETRLMKNIMEKSPDLYHFLIATYGYAGAMAEEISPKKEENSVSRA